MKAGEDLRISDLVIKGNRGQEKGTIIVKITCAELDSSMDGYADVTVSDDKFIRLSNNIEILE